MDVIAADTTNVENMSYMFSGFEKLTQIESIEK